MHDVFIRQAAQEDVDAVAALYDAANSDPETIRYTAPGWQKGQYPNRETAVWGLSESALFVAELDGAIAGAAIIDHDQYEGYERAAWQLQGVPRDKVLTLHALVTHPEKRGKGVGRALCGFLIAHGREQGMLSLRFSTGMHNLPACTLYRACGFTEVGVLEVEEADGKFYGYRMFEYVYSK